MKETNKHQNDRRSWAAPTFITSRQTWRKDVKEANLARAALNREAQSKKETRRAAKKRRRAERLLQQEVALLKPAPFPPRPPKLKVVKEKQPEKKNEYRTDRGFYSSDAWLQLRYEVLRRYGPKCMLCNATRADGIKLHVDHIKPRSKFPHLALVFENLQILCEDCNIGKSATDSTDWRPKQ